MRSCGLGWSARTLLRPLGAERACTAQPSQAGHQGSQGAALDPIHAYGSHVFLPCVLRNGMVNYRIALLGGGRCRWHCLLAAQVRDGGAGGTALAQDPDDVGWAEHKAAEECHEQQAAGAPPQLAAQPLPAPAILPRITLCGWDQSGRRWRTVQVFVLKEQAARATAKAKALREKASKMEIRKGSPQQVTAGLRLPCNCLRIVVRRSVHRHLRLSVSADDSGCRSGQDSSSGQGEPAALYLVWL